MPITIHRRGIAASLAGLVVLAAAWIFLAPVQLGGSTLYTVVVGNSMQPLLHRGDLVLARPQSSYRVGEVVLYQSSVIQRPVLHRIIAINDGHYFFKGDHNDFIDPGYATRSELSGQLWFKVPVAGRATAWLGKPLHAAFFAGAAALLILLSGTGVRRRRSRRQHPPELVDRSASNPGQIGSRSRRGVLSHPEVEGSLFLSIGLLVAAAIVLGIGFGMPSSRTALQPNAYEQSGTFSYSARVKTPSPAYPTGVATTGQALFLDSFNKVDLRFVYDFTSQLSHALTGTIELKALISSPSGWQNIYEVEKREAFSGDHAVTGGALDLVSMRALITQLSTAAGTPGAEYTVALQPVVRLKGQVGGKPFHTTFSPSLPVSVTQAVVKLDIAPTPPPGSTFTVATGDPTLTQALHPATTGSLPERVANHVAIARYEIPIWPFRGVGIGLALLALLNMLLGHLLVGRLAGRPEEELIAERYHCLIVPVASFETGTDAIAKVLDFESLARLASYSERPLLRESREGRFVYGVEDDDHLYIFEAAEPVETGPQAPTRLSRMPSSKERSRRWWFPHPLGLAALVVVAATLAASFAATTTVPVSHAGVSSQARQLAQLLPALCASTGATNLIIATAGTTTGTTGADLILGRNVTGTLSLNGGNGNDCIVAGGHAGTTNNFNGGSGTDVCIGPTAARNNFTSCEIQHTG
ncbi:MAG TPA: signal peptidase I [Gaiellaceae bacterium]|nr:signal peptidase I [Gaiellaceae bacterium]